MLRGAVSQARCYRVAPALRVAGGGLTRKLHSSTQLRGPEHDDFAPISKVVPDTDILEQIDEVRPSLHHCEHMDSSAICVVTTAPHAVHHIGCRQ